MTETIQSLRYFVKLYLSQVNKFRLERIVCVCVPSFTDITCNVKFLSRHVAQANGVAILKKEITSAKVTFNTYYKFSNNEYRPSLFETELDLCALQSGLYNTPLFTVFKNAILNISSFMDDNGNTTNIMDLNCPFPPGTYYLKDWSPDSKLIPSVVRINDQG